MWSHLYGYVGGLSEENKLGGINCLGRVFCGLGEKG